MFSFLQKILEAANTTATLVAIVTMFFMVGCDHPTNNPTATQQPVVTIAGKSHPLRPEDVVLSFEVDGKPNGAGFIARISGEPYFITNIHVVGDIHEIRLRTASGRVIDLPPQGWLVSRSRDLAMVRLPWNGNALKLSGADDMKAGAELASWTPSADFSPSVKTGSLLCVQTQNVEVTEIFRPGNSGSPVVRADNGTVIGVASYITFENLQGNEVIPKTPKQLEYLREISDLDNSFKNGNIDKMAFRTAKDKLLRLDEEEYLLELARLRKAGGTRKHFFAYRVDEDINQLQQVDLTALRKDWKFAYDFMDDNVDFEVALAYLQDSTSFSKADDKEMQKLFAVLKKYSLWNGRNAALDSSSLASFADKLETTAQAGQQYMDHELQVEFLRKSLAKWVKYRKDLAKACETLLVITEVRETLQIQ